MERNKYAELLEFHGVKPTANRIIIARTLASKKCPMSMKDLEQAIVSLDKSSIFRTLTVFRDHHVVHVIEGGEGGMKYELCNSHDTDDDDDEHVHFYCESCHRTFCLYDTPMPEIEMPEGYSAYSANYIIRGICPECNRKEYKLNRQ